MLREMNQNGEDGNLSRLLDLKDVARLVFHSHGVGYTYCTWCLNTPGILGTVQYDFHQHD